VKPLVSILIPAHNAESWLGDSVKSAIAQTWRHKEIIIVDDGSTDETLAVAKRFESNEVRVQAQPNQGAAVARNTAFSLAQGDYIQWLDADDILDPRKIESQIQRIEDGLSNRTLLSGAWAYFIYRPSKAQFVPTPLWHDLSPVDWLTTKMANNLHMQTDNWLVSRALTEAAGPWDPRLFRDNDGEYFCRVILASDGIQFVPGAKSYYRKASFKSISYIGGSNKKLNSLFLSLKLHVQYLLSLEDSERTRSACLAYLQTWLPDFYPNRPDLILEAQQLAKGLGGRLSLPKAPRKYAWIERLFGFAAAKQAQLHYSQVKSSALRAYDRVMYSLQRNSKLSS
jgi:glycosyltransferase involved in cell wall biosynthesis